MIDLILSVLYYVGCTVIFGYLVIVVCIIFKFVEDQILDDFRKNDKDINNKRGN